MQTKFGLNPEVTAIMGVFDTYLRHNQTKGEQRSYLHYHPSEFGKCLRNAQYRLYAEMGLIKVSQEVNDSKKQRLFDKGHNMHNRWVNYAGWGGFLRGVWRCENRMCGLFDDNGDLRSNVTPEQRQEIIRKASFRRKYGEDDIHGCFRPKCCACGCYDFEYMEVAVIREDLNFKGHADMLFDFSNITSDSFKDCRLGFNIDSLPKGLVVCDMKTCNSNSFRKLKKNGPTIAYIIQLIIYCNILDCEYGLLIYECKDDSEILSFKIDKDPDSFKIIEDQAKIMLELKDKRKLPPPRPLTKDDYECKYCNFRIVCNASGIWDKPNLSQYRKDFYKNLL